MAARIRTPLIIEFSQEATTPGAVATNWTATMGGDLIDYTVQTVTDGATGVDLRKAGVSMLAIAVVAGTPINTLARATGLAAGAARTFVIGDVLSTLPAGGGALATTVAIGRAWILPTTAQSPSTLALNAQ